MRDSNITTELEFSAKIKEMGDRDLMEFTALQIYSIRYEVADHHKRIKKLENRNRKEIGIVGTIGGILGVAFASVLDFFIRRG